jgi:hypothetical protein
MFDINNLNPTAKFYWPGSRKKEWVELRNIPTAQLRKMRKETVRQEIEYHRPDNSNEKPFRYEVDKVDDDKLFDAMWDYQIVNWQIVDLDGNEIPCTTENKLLMVGNSKEFADWIVKCLNQLAIDEIKKKEKSEKN